jgi:hypothetical protein
LGNTTENIRISDIMSHSSINHDFMKLFKIIRKKNQARLHWLQNPSQMYGDNKMYDVMLAEISGPKKANIRKTKLMCFKRSGRTKILQTCTEA